jgi:uncharacterized Zn-binding protein involved in type VI secretion
MPGSPVTIGASVVVTPGASGPPDTGVIIMIPPPFITANGLPLATSGAICQMVNSVWGVPYPLVIGPRPGATVSVNGQALVRMGDAIPTPPGVLVVLGPPAAPFITDSTP